MLEKSLRNCIKFISKGVAPKYVEEENSKSIRVLNQKCNRDNKISFKLSRLNDLAQRKVPKEKILQGNDILINSTGTGTAGRVAQIKAEQLTKPTTVDGHMIIIRPADNIDACYLGYALISNQRLIESFAEGSTGQTEINRERLLDEIFIKAPSYNKQRSIAHKLKVIDRKVELNNEINDNLLELARVNYYKLNTTTRISMKDIATVVMGQSPKSSTYNTLKQGLPLLNGAADFRNEIIPSKWTTDPKKIVQSGTYIFGVRATIGLTKKVHNNYAIGRGTGSATAKEDYLDEFLYFSLEDMFNYFSKVGSGSVYINISKNDINNYETEIPTKKALTSFHNLVAPMFNLIYKNQDENIKLENLKLQLLNKYF